MPHERLSPEEVAARQAEMDRLKRIYNGVVATCKAMSPEERAAYRARLEQKGIVGMGAYRKQLIAAKDTECAAPVDYRARLRDAGVEAQHLDGLRSLDERYSFQAAQRWWSQARVQSGETDELGEDGVLRRVPRLIRRFPFLVLLGGSGLGKTQAAAWCLKEAARAYPWNSMPGGANGQRRPLLVLTGPDFARLPLYGNHDKVRVDFADDALEEARRAVLLVLDDMPPRSGISRPHMDALSALLMARHGERRATILTANMDAKTLEERLDGDGSGSGSKVGPLWRRVSEQGVVVTLKHKAHPDVLAGGVPAPWTRDERSVK